MFSHKTIDDPVVVPMANAFPWRVVVKTPVIGKAVEIDLRGLTEEDLVSGGLTREMAAALLTDYFSHILVLLDKHGSRGYYHNDSNIIEFPDGANVVWYELDEENPPTVILNLDEERKFDLLRGSRFNELKNM